MLISIVKCGDHNRTESFGQPGKVSSSSSEIEVLGPIHAPSVTQMRNQGARQAKGRWIFFTDADCIVDSKLIMAVVHRIEGLSEPLIAIGGLYNDRGQSVLHRTYSFIQRVWINRGLGTEIAPNIVEASHLLGGALLVRKDRFFAVGGFNNQIGWGGEELDLVGRIKKAGGKTALCYDLQVDHSNSLSISGLIKRAWFQNFNRSRHSLNVATDRSIAPYLSIPLQCLAPTFLFFSVSIIAQSAGSVVRMLRG